MLLLQLGSARDLNVAPVLENVENYFLDCIDDVSKTFFAQINTIFFISSSYKCEENVYSIDSFTYKPTNITAVMGENSCTTNLSIKMVDFGAQRDQIIAFKKFSRTGRDVKEFCTFGHLEDFEMEIIKNLQLFNNWSITLFPYNSYISFINPNEIGGFIIMIKFNGDYNVLSNYVFNCVLVLSKYKIMNSISRFMIVVKGSGNSKKISNTILKVFGNIAIHCYNIILLIHEENYSNVSIYSYNFYDQKSFKCGMFLGSSLIHTCVSNQNDIEYIFYEDRIPGTEECYITPIGTLHEPLVIAEINGSEMSYGYSNESVSIMLIKIAIDRINHIRLAYYNMWQEELELSFVYLNEDINIDTYLTFAYYYTSQYYWYIPKAKPYPRWSNITRVFDGPTWISLVISLFVGSLIMRYLNEGSQDLSLCLFNSLAFLLGIGIEIPQKLHVRLFIFCWLIYSLAINTVFQSYFTSFMVDPRFQHQINSFEELSKLNYDLFFVSPESLYAYAELNVTKYMHIIIGPMNAIAYALSKTKGAVYISEESMEHFYNTVCDELRTELHRIEEAPQQHHIGVKLTEPSVGIRLRKLISRLVEAGINIKTVSDALYSRPTGNKKEYNLESYVPFSVKHLKSAIYLYLIGNVLGFISLVCELISHSTILKFILNHC
ncbi:hypothetical protein L9F63_018422 [Diploptera punctata]|uniref:Uncharacterized protein n=1 Tax=Diploptera punctata TaxID=6984 RepID=A0AAD7ZWZ1_DIPPU|nr:hypothetical protein L9F63_018422 [Diploptera punctata]